MKGTFKGLAVAGTAAALLVGALASSGPAYADKGGDANVTICHAAGRAGTTHYRTITVGWPAAYGPAGHFNENGTPRAGHEDDSVGPCEADSVDETPDSVDETIPENVDETIPETIPENVDETIPELMDETPGIVDDTTTPVLASEAPVPVLASEAAVPVTASEAAVPALASEAPVPTTAVAAASGTLPVTGSTANTWMALSALTLCGLGSVLWALSRRSPAA